MEEFLRRMGKRLVSPRPGFTDRLWSRLKERDMIRRVLDMIVDEGLPVTIDGEHKIPKAKLEMVPSVEGSYDYEAKSLTDAGGHQLSGGRFHVEQVAYIHVDHNEITIVLGAF